MELKTVAYIITGGMALIGLAGLIFAVTQKSRKENKLFSYSKLPDVEDVMTKEQIEFAQDFLDDHKKHVLSITKDVNLATDVPTEDMSNPILWKPTHWNWFIYWRKN